MQDSCQSHSSTSKPVGASPAVDLKDVTKVKRYNSHPSGIECILIIRGMNFDIGSAFKYVFRRQEKEFERSLKSALYYLKDQMEHRLQAVLDTGCVALIQKVIEAEENESARSFYQAVWAYCNFPHDRHMLEAIKAVENLIKEGDGNAA